MPRHDKTGRSKGGGRFVAIPFAVLDSPGYAETIPAERAVLIERGDPGEAAGERPSHTLVERGSDAAILGVENDLDTRPPAHGVDHRDAIRPATRPLDPPQVDFEEEG